MTTTTPDLHVVFGSGPLGQSVVRALLHRGRRVRVVNRRGQWTPTLPDPAGGTVEAVKADVYDAASARAAAQGAAVVYQCAQPEYHEWTTKFVPLQASILAAAAGAGAKFIVGDNLYMYGPVAGRIHEALPNAAHTRKGKVRAALAETVLEAHRQGVVRAAIGRGLDFYGPGVEGSALGGRFFAPLIAGKPAEVMGDVDALHSYTFIDDFGEALAALGEHDPALGQVWHVPNAPAVTMTDLLRMIGTITGTPPSHRVAGRLFLMFGGLFVPAAREMVEMLYEFEQPFVVDDGKYRTAFPGHTPVPLLDGLRRTLAWYRTHAAAG